MKQFLLLITTLISLQMSAQFTPVTSRYDSDEFIRTFHESVAADMKARYAKRQVLSPNKHLFTSTLWSNGLFRAIASYDSDTRTFLLSDYEGADPDAMGDPFHAMEVKPGGHITFEETSSPIFTLERYGNYNMLVGRGKDGQPIYAYYCYSADEAYNNRWKLPLMFVLAGNYETPDGNHAVFGPKMDFYKGNSFDTDPGVFDAFMPSDGGLALDILYGDGRMSHGDPGSERYGQMPGGGGAGAIMGPMQWQLTMTAAGMLVTVVQDQKFVDHNPRVESGSELRRVQSPYQGIHGQWPFTSVIPLSHQLLRLFPREVLTLMRGEIYARHGDSFRDPDTQRYFDAQTWYKKAAGPVRLTAIEKFNYNLIRSVEQDL